MDYFILLSLCLLSLVFFILEIFFLPGITIAGIGGVLFLGGALYYAYTIDPTWVIPILITYGIAIAVAFLYFMRSRSWNKLALHTDISAKVESKTTQIEIGQTGKTISRLAPMGQIVINGITVEAKAEEELIDENTDIIVTAVHSNNVTVKSFVK